MKVAVLTSSRADYGIYTPLLKGFSTDSRFEVEIIAFGMHLLPEYGNTVQRIEEDGFGKIHRVEGFQYGDDPQSVTANYGRLILNFAEFWKNHSYDWVICLGDRFEMSAAVQSGIPFEVKFAHLHGGETTLGVKDDIYRHQISLASALHFTAAEQFAEKLKAITGMSDNIYNVGALSLDGIEKQRFIDWEETRLKFNIPAGEFILITFHPETVGTERNSLYVEEISKALRELKDKYLLVITLPNADAMGSLYRQSFEQMQQEFPERVVLIENFGRNYYFSAMKASAFLLGNTSSGILEAASFGKFAVNVGERQAGRLRSDNVMDVGFDSAEIVKLCKRAAEMDEFRGVNRYAGKNTAESIKEIIYESEL